MPLNDRPAAVGDGALITSFGRERAGYVVKVSRTGLRVRVHYLAHASRTGRIGERWEAVDRVVLVDASDTCADCDAQPTHIDGDRHDAQPGAGLRMVCRRHARPTAPPLPTRPIA